MPLISHAINDERFSLCSYQGTNESEDNITDMSLMYQIFPDEVLGSGQFGTVYGGEDNFPFLISPASKTNLLSTLF